MAHDNRTANVKQGTKPGWYNNVWVKMGSKNNFFKYCVCHSSI